MSKVSPPEAITPNSGLTKPRSSTKPPSICAMPVILRCRSLSLKRLNSNFNFSEFKQLYPYNKKEIAEKSIKKMSSVFKGYSLIIKR